MAGHGGYEVRIATERDAARVSALVHESFSTLAAKDWSPAAQECFLAEVSSVEQMARKIADSAFSAVAVAGAEVVGFILMPAPAVLGMLFVHSAWLRRGIATALWEAARAHIETHFPEVKTVELNSTPYATLAYRALGFVPISREFEQAGCRATRMACWLPARGLNAGLD
jgi:GNAT superfamily N-acetyltransferase